MHATQQQNYTKLKTTANIALSSQSITKQGSLNITVNMTK